MTDRRPSLVRVVAVIRLLDGSALLLAPDAVLGCLPGAAIDHRAPDVARVLGARQVVQAMAADRWRSRGPILAGAAVDGAQAVSMIALALLDRRRRDSPAPTR